MTPSDGTVREPKAVAIEEVGGDETGANTGLKPGEQPIIPRAKDGTPLGNDRAVPDRLGERGAIDVDGEQRRLRPDDVEQQPGRH